MSVRVFLVTLDRACESGPSGSRAQVFLHYTQAVGLTDGANTGQFEGDVNDVQYVSLAACPLKSLKYLFLGPSLITGHSEDDAGLCF